jgi:hypothetical protein
MKLIYILTISLILLSCEKSPFNKKRIYIQSVTATPKSNESVTIKNETGEVIDLSKWSVGELNNPNSFIFTNTIIDDGQILTIDSLPFDIKDSGAIIYLRDNNSKSIDNWQN